MLAGETPVLVHNNNCSPFTDGDIWDGSFKVGGQTVEAMAIVRAAGNTVHLDGFMVFSKGTQGLSRAPIGPDAIRQMKRSIAEQARSQGYGTVVLNSEQSYPETGRQDLQAPRVDDLGRRKDPRRLENGSVSTGRVGIEHRGSRASGAGTGVSGTPGGPGELMHVHVHSDREFSVDVLGESVDENFVGWAVYIARAELL